MADKLIPNDDTQKIPLLYLWLKLLDTQLNELTNQNSRSPQSS